MHRHAHVGGIGENPYTTGSMIHDGIDERTIESHAASCKIIVGTPLTAANDV